MGINNDDNPSNGISNQPSRRFSRFRKESGHGKGPKPASAVAVALLARKERLMWKGFFFLIAAAMLVIFFGLQGPSEFRPINIEKLPSMGNVIARVSITGEISSAGSRYRSKVLHTIAKSENVKGVLLSINSPGGGAGASEILYWDLRSIALNKPTVASVQDMAASGGYMAAISADVIYAYSMSMVGSIGVIFSHPDVKDLIEKVGIDYKFYRTSEYKATPTLFEHSSEKVSEEVRRRLDEGYAIFTNLVSSRRGLKGKDLEVVSTGQVFSGRSAIGLGLVDVIGSESDAITHLRRMMAIARVSSGLSISRMVSLAKQPNMIPSATKLISDEQGQADEGPEPSDEIKEEIKDLKVVDILIDEKSLEKGLHRTMANKVISGILNFFFNSENQAGMLAKYPVGSEISYMAA